MPKKQCVYHQKKPLRLVSCFLCEKLVCVDDTYPVPVTDIEKKMTMKELKQRKQQKGLGKKRVRMCIPCHADFKSSEFKRVEFLAPCVVGILIAMAVIVIGFPFLEAVFRSTTDIPADSDIIVVYGWVFAVLITFFMIPTLAATLIVVYLYQKWKSVKKYQLEKKLFLESVSS